MQNALVIPRLGFEITEKKKTLTAMFLVPVLLLFLTACPLQTFQNSVQKVEGIVAEAIPGVSLVLALLPLVGVNVPQSVITAVTDWTPQVTSGLSKLNDLLAKLKAASDAAKPDLLSQVNAQAQLVASQIASFLPVFHVLDPALQAKITGVVQAVADAVNTVINLVSMLQGNKTLVRIVHPVHSGSDLKSRINAILSAPSGDPAVDAASAKVLLK